MYSVLQLITAHLQCEAAKTNFFSGLWQIPHFNGVHGPILPKKDLYPENKIRAEKKMKYLYLTSSASYSVSL